VDHLDVVTSTIIAHPVTAWFAITLGGNALKNVLDVWPRFFIATRHQARAVARTFLTSRDTGTDEADSLLSQVFASAIGIRVMRVSTIDDDVTLLTKRKHSLDEIVDGLSGLDEEHHAAGLLEHRHELLDGVGANDRFP